MNYVNGELIELNLGAPLFVNLDKIGYKTEDNKYILCVIAKNGTLEVASEISEITSSESGGENKYYMDGQEISISTYFDMTEEDNIARLQIDMCQQNAVSMNMLLDYANKVCQYSKLENNYINTYRKTLTFVDENAQCKLVDIDGKEPLELVIIDNCFCNMYTYYDGKLCHVLSLGFSACGRNFKYVPGRNLISFTEVGYAGSVGYIDFASMKEDGTKEYMYDNPLEIVYGEEYRHEEYKNCAKSEDGCYYYVDNKEVTEKEFETYYPEEYLHRDEEIWSDLAFIEGSKEEVMKQLDELEQYN